MGSGQVRREPKRLGALRYCLPELPLAKKRARQVGARLRIGWIGPDRRRKVLDGLLHGTSGEENGSQNVFRPGVVRHEPERLPAMGDRLLGSTLRAQCCGETRVSLG